MAIGIGVGSKGVTGSASSVVTGGVTTQASGSVILVGVTWDNSRTFTSIVDSKSNTYTQIGSQTAVGSGLTRWYYKENAAGGASHTVTVTVSGAAAITISMIEITGAATSGALDQSTGRNDNATPFTLAAGLTTTQAAEALATVVSGDSGNNPATHAETGLGSSTVQSSTNETNGSSFWCQAIATKIVSATGTFNPSWTETGATQANVLLATFKEAGGVTLTVDDATHGHSTDAIALTQANTLVVTDATHGHAADNLALTQAHILALADALHAHAADSLTLSVAALLAIADSLHAHTTDAIALTQAHLLAVADALHAHSSDAMALTQANTLAVAETRHTHAADSPTLQIAGTLAVADATHGHTADNIVLVQAHVLTVSETRHTHTVDNLVLSEATLLAVADALHAHGVDAVSLTQAHLLAVASAVHGHAVDSPALTQASILIVSDTLHAHVADLLALQIPVDAIADSRVIVIQDGGRIVAIAALNTSVTVH